jgi:hypothetical protein
MSARGKQDDRRVPPDESGWLEAQRSVAERNETARAAARVQRESHQRELDAQRAERERDTVYR